MNSNKTTLKIAITGVLLAMNIALSSFGLTVPGGHLYLNDIVIVVAGLLLDPFQAFVVGGIGAFIGDLLFYPIPMFVSLVTHGLQAIVISYFAHKSENNKNIITGVLLGAIIMIVGYTLGRAFIYSTVSYAILKLPFQILQASVGAILGIIIVRKGQLNKYIK